MANILAFNQHQAFDPNTTHLMAEAFDAAWAQLQGTGHIASAPFRAEATREQLARSIVLSAQRGIRDTDLMRHEALLSLGAGLRKPPQVPRDGGSGLVSV